MHSSLEIPALPAAHARALALIGAGEVSIVDLAEVIEGDPSLTAAVLRAANSAASAPLTRIKSARPAVVRIGLPTTRGLVMCAIATRSFERLGEAGIDVDEAWRHQMAVALVSQALTLHGAAVTSEGELAFTIGVLHDVGRLAMAAQEPQRYLRVVEMVANGADPLRAEAELFGTDHAAWGAEISGSWRISPVVPETIAKHHDVPEPGSLAASLGEARRLVGSLGIGDGVRPGTEISFPETGRDESLLSSLGGPDGLVAQLDWYQGAMAAA